MEITILVIWIAWLWISTFVVGDQIAALQTKIQAHVIPGERYTMGYTQGDVGTGIVGKLPVNSQGWRK